MVYKADVDDADDYDRWFSSVCAGHLNLIVAADDGTFTRVTVTRVLLPFEEGGGWFVAWEEDKDNIWWWIVRIKKMCSRMMRLTGWSCLCERCSDRVQLQRASKSSQSLLREVVNNSLQVHRPSATSAMHANSRSKSYFGVGNNLDQNRSLIQNLHDKKGNTLPFLKR